MSVMIRAAPRAAGERRLAQAVAGPGRFGRRPVPVESAAGRAQGGAEPGIRGLLRKVFGEDVTVKM
ncbi:hypothetical protein I5Q34_29355 [Streptomyces sp. AV19]|uniref:hypothetical protein n=1 Tax=Streptomyces sp. AV19 TaxID=2793068 RepID=UPI0018FED81A|nr:hypothetical protein [Streptomyces sp. AV19]MBH1938316.1 hypothetical protein [Streptomyces sp. AV19]MDG4534957.1 hypothetical protein [Streptomyces sp. AV19]